MCSPATTVTSRSWSWTAARPTARSRWPRSWPGVAPRSGCSTIPRAWSRPRSTSDSAPPGGSTWPSSIRMTSTPRPPCDSPSPTWRRILTARSPISYYDFIDDAGCAVEHLGVVRHLEYDRNVILRTNGAGAVRVWHRVRPRAPRRVPRGVVSRLRGGLRHDPPALRALRGGPGADVLYRWRLHASNSEQLVSIEDRVRKKALARAHALDRRAELLRSRW